MIRPLKQQSRRHSLGVSVMPLSSDGVLLKQRWDPVFAFGLALAGRLPLGFLQNVLLVGGLRLVLAVDGSGHVLPQPDEVQRKHKIYFSCVVCVLSNAMAKETRDNIMESSNYAIDNE